MFALWGFAVAATYVPGIYSAPYMPRYWAIAIGLAAFASLDLRALDEKILWCMGVLLLWSGLTLLWSPSLYGGILLWGFWAMFCLLVVAVASASEAQRRLAFAGFAAGMVVSAVLCVPQYFFGWTFIPQGAVPGGLFFNCEVFAETAAPIAVWCAIVSCERSDNGSVIVRFVPIVAAVILAFAVLLTQERIAAAVLAIGLVYGLVNNWRWRAALMAAIGVAGFAALALRYTHSADTRIMYWGAAWLSSSFAGSGLGWWFQAHPFPHEEYVHSDALQSLVEIGAASLALFAIPVLAWFGHGGHGSRAERAAMVALIVECLVSFPLHMPATLFLFALCTGALCSRRADVRVPGLSRRENHVDGAGQQAAYGSGVFASIQRLGALVSNRPAFAQYANHDRASNRGVGVA
jgi:hypothetical protein